MKNISIIDKNTFKTYATIWASKYDTHNDLVIFFDDNCNVTGSASIDFILSSDLEKLEKVV